MTEELAENFKTPVRVAESSNNDATCLGEFSPVVSEFASPNSAVVPLKSVVLEAPKTAEYLNWKERAEKFDWVIDYAEDIFQTLREVELGRREVSFRSEQFGYRHSLLHLLRSATEKHNLARTTLHLAVYLLDVFMDKFTIRLYSLNLTALTCLIVAAKVEEAEMNIPRFAQLNELVSNNYVLADFKRVECKLLIATDFDLLRPTTATFIEYFAYACLSMDDYNTYVRNWHNGTLSSVPLVLPPLYTSHEEMLKSLNKMMFALVDMALDYFKFANVRPSILAAASVAAGRQLHRISPIWTPCLEAFTESMECVIAPYIEPLISVYKLKNPVVSSTEVDISVNLPNISWGSPDSGIVLSDMKSCQSSTEDSADNGEDDPHQVFEYPRTKKRRLF